MKRHKTPVWKGLLAILSLSIILSLGAVSVFADERAAGTDSEPQIVTSQDMEGNQEELSTESTNETDSLSESTEDTEEKEELSEVAAQSDAASDASSAAESTVSDNKVTVATNNMYRFYNPNSGEHFYTASKKEGLYLRNQGWSYEGIGWVAPKKSNTPVYRLYNPNAGDHHYTRSTRERDYLINQGWKSEGTGWYSDDNKTVALRRQYNKNATTGTHNYTTSAKEANYLIGLGWTDEGIGWYAVSGGKKGNAIQDIGAVTWYQGKDYSSIYDYSYYVSHNADLASISSDDTKVLEHFMTYGILEGRQAKEGVSPSSSAYQTVKKQVQAQKEAEEAAEKAAQKAAEEAKKAAEQSKDLQIANTYDSNTNYLILVNRNAHKVYIYQGNGKKGSWTRIKEWSCSDGKSTTPTTEGVWMIYGHTYMMTGGSHEFYASWFHGSQYFHSILYSASATSPSSGAVIDGRLGVAISHGCVRLATENAKWIYDNIPMHTTVVVTHW